MTTGTGVISGVSVSHERASVDDIEAACTESQRHAAEILRRAPGVTEAFVLQTCNRAEAYVVTDQVEQGRAALDAYVAGVEDDAIREMEHEESLRHLLRVAAGLESIVLGEDQILGQVSAAYEDARGVDAIGPMLDEGVTKALRVGERARSETAINEGTVSLGSAAVNLAREEWGLEASTALVVGAGEMAGLVSKALDDEVRRVIVANRTVPHAEHIVEGLDSEGAAVGLDAIPSTLHDADLVITATGSPDPIVERATLETAGETFVVDLAQPRDVPAAAAEITDVIVRDLDTLESVTEESRSQRAVAAEAVEAIVDEEFDNLLSQYKRKRADQVIGAMYESAERVKARELRTAFEKLEDLDEEQRAVIESMTDALVGQLLAPPTQSLRDAAEEDDWSTINTALQLFDPDFGSDVPDFVSSMDPEEIPEDMKSEMPTAVLNQLDD